MPLTGLVQPNIRDGSYCFDSNSGGGPNYYPNSFDSKKEDVTQRASKWKLPVIVEIRRYDTTQDENYSQVNTRRMYGIRKSYRHVFQVTKFWHNLPPHDQDHLIYNMAIHLAKAQGFIQNRWLHHVKKAHYEYYRRLKEALDFVKG